MLSGLKPAVVALVITATIRVARRSLDTALQRTVALGAFAAMTWLHASLPLVMLSVILLGVLVGRCRPDLLGPASMVESHACAAESDARVPARNPAAGADYPYRVCAVADTVVLPLPIESGFHVLEAAFVLLYADSMRHVWRLLYGHSLCCSQRCDKVSVAEPESNAGRLLIG